MRYCVIFSCLICMLAHKAAAQTFSVTLGSSTAIEGAEAMAKFGNDLLVGGTKNDSAFIMRLGPTGTLVWVRTFKAATPGKTFVNFLSTTSNGYIIGTAHALTATPVSGAYFKMDGAGNFIFLKSNTSGFYFKKIQEISPANYVVFGAKYGTTTGTDLKILTVNQVTGNIVSETQKINLTSMGMTTSTDDMEAATVVGSYMYTAGRIWCGSGATSAMRPHLAKYNASGTVIWSKYLHKNYLLASRTYPQEILYEAPSTFYIPYFSDETCSGFCNNYIPGLMKVDTNGTVLFDKTYDIDLSDGELLRAIVSDGTNLFMVGHTNFNSGQHDFFVIKVDKSGNVLKSKRFGSLAYDELFETSMIQPVYCDSSFIYIAGTVGADIALMKIDTDLDMTCNAFEITCNQQNVTPFQGNITTDLVTETISVNDLASKTGNFPSFNGCDSTGLTDSLYSTSAVTLDVTSSGADGYFWNTGSTDPVIVVSQSGVYTVIVNDGCCSFTKTFVVCIRPANGILMDSTVTCEMRQYAFLPVASQNNDFTWYIDGVLFSSATTIAPPLDSGLHTITLLVTNPVCHDSVWSNMQTFSVSKPTFQGTAFIIPTIFTPNGDGVNDFLKSQISPCENYDIKIYNRWGMEMYTSTDINTWWDGKLNGNDVAEGEYAFIIHYNRSCEANNAVQLVKGWVTLKR